MPTELSPERKLMIQTQAKAARRNIVFTIVLLILLYLAYVLRNELTLIYVSALVAVVLTPLSRAIMRVRIGRWKPGVGASVVVLMLVVVALAAIFFVYSIPPVIHDLSDLASEIPKRAPELLNRIKSLPLMNHLDVNRFDAQLQNSTTWVVSYLLESAKDWARIIYAVITGIVLTIYFMIDGGRVYGWMMQLVPQQRRDRLERTLIRAEARMGRWLIGQGMLMLILGFASTITFLCLHIRYPYALGVLMGAFNIIPIVGPMVSVSLAVLVAALDSWSRVLGVLIFYIIYQQLETSLLTPRIMKSSVNLSGITVLIALLLGSSLDGIAGAAVAVPSAVLISVLLEEYVLEEETQIVTTDHGA